MGKFMLCMFYHNIKKKPLHSECFCCTCFKNQNLPACPCPLVVLEGGTPRMLGWQATE